MWRKAIVGAVVIVSLAVMSSALDSKPAIGDSSASVAELNKVKAYAQELNDEVYRLKGIVNDIDHRATAGNHGAYEANERLDALPF